MRKTGLFYARFMDDWVILSPTRWKLRRAIATVNGVLQGLKLLKHPDKTSIGTIARGFDFLGYHCSRAGLGVARKTVGNFLDNLARLYEQQACAERLGQYVQDWYRWLRTGVEPILDPSVRRLVACCCLIRWVDKDCLGILVPQWSWIGGFDESDSRVH